MRNPGKLKNDSFHGETLPKGVITSGAHVNAPYRSLKDVSYEELKQAVIHMCDELGISGSGNGYSLFTAIFQEKKKVSPEDPVSELLD